MAGKSKTPPPPKPNALELKRKGGYTPADLRQYTAQELHNAGFAATELKGSHQPSELKGWYPLKDLKAAGYTVPELKPAFDASRMKDEGGYSARDLKKDYTASELKNAGYPLDDFKDLYPARDLKAAGITATDLKKVNYRAPKLEDAYTPTEAKSGGFTLAELKDVFPTSELKDAGYKVQDFKEAKFTVSDVKTDFDPKELNAGGYADKDIIPEYSAQELKNAGYTAEQLKKASVDAREAKKAYTLTELKTGGYTLSDALDVIFEVWELKEVGFTAKEFHDETIVAKILNECFTAKELRDGGYRLNELVEGQYGPRELREAGYPAKRLKDKFRNARFHESGFPAPELKRDGFTIEEAKERGYSAAECKVQGAWDTEAAEVDRVFYGSDPSKKTADQRKAAKAGQVGLREMAEKVESFRTAAEQFYELDFQKKGKKGKASLERDMRELGKHTDVNKRKLRRDVKTAGSATGMAGYAALNDNSKAFADKASEYLELKRGWDAHKTESKKREEAYEKERKELVELISLRSKQLINQRNTILHKLPYNGKTVQKVLSEMVEVRDAEYKKIQEKVASATPTSPLLSILGDPSAEEELDLDVIDTDTSKDMTGEPLRDYVILEKKIEKMFWTIGELDAELAGLRELESFVKNVRGVWMYANRVDKWHRSFLKVANSVVSAGPPWWRVDQLVERGLEHVILKKGNKKEKPLVGTASFSISIGAGVAIGVGGVVEALQIGLSVAVSGKLEHSADRRIRCSLSLQLIPDFSITIGVQGAKMFEIAGSLGFTMLDTNYTFIDANHFAYYLSFRVANLVHFSSKFVKDSQGIGSKLHQYIDVFDEDIKHLLKKIVGPEKFKEMSDYLSKKTVTRVSKVGAVSADLGFSSTIVGGAAIGGSVTRALFERQRLFLPDSSTAAAAPAPPPPQGDYWKYDCLDSLKSNSLYASVAFLLDVPLEAARLRSEAMKTWDDNHKKVVAYDESEKEFKKRSVEIHEKQEEIRELRKLNFADERVIAEHEKAIKSLSRLYKKTERAAHQEKIDRIKPRILKRDEEIRVLNGEIDTLQTKQDDERKKQDDLHKQRGTTNQEPVPGEAYWRFNKDGKGKITEKIEQVIGPRAKADHRHVAALALKNNVAFKVHRPASSTILLIKPAGSSLPSKTFHLYDGGADGFSALKEIGKGETTAPQHNPRLHKATGTAYKSTSYYESYRTARATRDPRLPSGAKLITEARRGLQVGGAFKLSMAPAWLKTEIDVEIGYTKGDPNPDNDGITATLRFAGALMGFTNLEMDFSGVDPYEGHPWQGDAENFGKYGKDPLSTIKEKIQEALEKAYGDLPKMDLELGLDMGSKRYMEMNLALNEGIVLENIWWLYQDSIGGTGKLGIPTGVPGLDVVVKGGIETSRTVVMMERLGMATLGYINTVFGGLRLRPDGLSDWMIFLNRNAQYLNRLFYNIAKNQARLLKAEIVNLEKTANLVTGIPYKSAATWPALEDKWCKEIDPAWVPHWIPPTPTQANWTPTATGGTLEKILDASLVAFPQPGTPPAKKFGFRKDKTATINKKLCALLTAALGRAADVNKFDHEVKFPWKRKTIYLTPPKGRITFSLVVNPTPPAGSTCKFKVDGLPVLAGHPPSLAEMMKDSASGRVDSPSTLVDVFRDPVLRTASSALEFYQQGFEIELKIHLKDLVKNKPGPTLTVIARQPDGSDAFRDKMLRFTELVRRATAQSKMTHPIRSRKRPQDAFKSERYLDCFLTLNTEFTTAPPPPVPPPANPIPVPYPTLKSALMKAPNDDWRLESRTKWDKIIDEHKATNPDWDPFENILEQLTGPFWT